MTKVLEVLKLAREKISEEKHWIKRNIAIDAKGNSIAPNSKRACAWCILGAIDAVTDIQSWSGKHALDRLRQEIPHTSIGGFNDSPSTTHTMVLAAFDRAIAAEEAAK